MVACVCRRRRSHTYAAEEVRRPKVAWEGPGADVERGPGPPVMAMLYPMYVLRVKDFLQMAALEPHQTLRARGAVKQFNGSRSAVFVSHQWCGRRNADPDWRQLRALQGVFRRGAGGTLRVGADLLSMASYRMKACMRSQDFLGAGSWVMWYDYFSAPQPGSVCPDGRQVDYSSLASDLGKAVASLASYVESCALFMVLAPAVRHEDGHLVDYATWMERGWCRFERLARQLSREDAAREE